MLFRIEAGKDPFEINDGLKAIPEFAKLTARQISFVILASDYGSPFRKLTPEARRRQAALIAGYKETTSTGKPDDNFRDVINGQVRSIESAIRAYKTLQKDEDYETLLSLNRLIADIRDLNNKPDKTAVEIEKAVNINVQKLDKILETKRKIEELIDARDDEPAKLTDDDKLAELSTDEQNLPLLAQLNAGLLSNK